jgi:hypothetical protein
MISSDYYRIKIEGQLWYGTRDINTDDLEECRFSRDPDIEVKFAETGCNLKRNDD